jgi:hypothetical protein
VQAHDAQFDGAFSSHPHWSARQTVQCRKGSHAFARLSGATRSCIDRSRLFTSVLLVFFRRVRSRRAFTSFAQVFAMTRSLTRRGSRLPRSCRHQKDGRRKDVCAVPLVLRHRPFGSQVKLAPTLSSFRQSLRRPRHARRPADISATTPLPILYFGRREPGAQPSPTGFTSRGEPLEGP